MKVQAPQKLRSKTRNELYRMAQERNQGTFGNEKGGVNKFSEAYVPTGEVGLVIYVSFFSCSFRVEKIYYHRFQSNLPNTTNNVGIKVIAAALPYETPNLCRVSTAKNR